MNINVLVSILENIKVEDILGCENLSDQLIQLLAISEASQEQNFIQDKIMAIICQDGKFIADEWYLEISNQKRGMDSTTNSLLFSYELRLKRKDDKTGE